MTKNITYLLTLKRIEPKRIESIESMKVMTKAKV